MKNLMGTSAIVACLVLGGCSENMMYAPPTATEHRVQLEQNDIDETLLVSDVDDALLMAVAQHHRRYGDGEVGVLITYDPRSYKNTAMEASEAAASIAKSLRENGVDHVNASILPVKDLGDEAKVTFSYEAYSVSAPEDCNGDLPGLHGDKLENNNEYKIGCSVKTLLAKQVVRSSDLKGRGQEDMTSDGRSAANVVNYVRSGTFNESLGGESATGD